MKFLNITFKMVIYEEVMSIMKFPSIDEFLNTEEGNTISFLTRCSYFDIPLPGKIKMKKFHSFISSMDVIYYDFKEYDLFVFQGTSCMLDWIANITMVLCIKPYQFKSALRFVKRYFNRNKKTYISGHSLGGAITQYIVTEFEHNDNVIGISYNGAGVKHLLKCKNTHKIYNFISTKDILNRITKKLPGNYFKHIGTIKMIEDNVSKNGFDAHSNFEIFLH